MWGCKLNRVLSIIDFSSNALSMYFTLKIMSINLAYFSKVSQSSNISVLLSLLHRYSGHSAKNSYLNMTALSHLNTPPHGKDCSLFSTYTGHRDLLQLSIYLCYSTMSHQCSKGFTFSHCSAHSGHFLKVCCSQNHCTARYHLALVSSCRLHIPACLFNLCPLCHHLPHLHHHYLQSGQQLSCQNIHIKQKAWERHHLSVGEVCNLCTPHTLQSLQLSACGAVG